MQLHTDIFPENEFAAMMSVNVRQSLERKRKAGLFVGAFAPYGYHKDPDDRNHLIIDLDAAWVVMDIFFWYVDGMMTKAGIARKLNSRCIPSPTAYKQDCGEKYVNPRAQGLWTAAAVSRILNNPLYVGVLQQGKQRVMSHRVHTRLSVPQAEWCIVEDAVPPILNRDYFDVAQALHKRAATTV